jgi:hypothetical protein
MEMTWRAHVARSLTEDMAVRDREGMRWSLRGRFEKDRKAETFDEG